MNVQRAVMSGNAPPPAASEPLDFRAVYDAHLPLVVRTLRRFGVPEASLEDAAQDAFSVVYRKLPEFEGRSSVRTWLFSIARRVARDHRPKKREAFVMELGDGHGLPAEPHDAAVERLEGVRRLYRLIAALRPERAEVFVLVEVEQFTLSEAAEVLEVNVNTVASRLRAARQELSELLARADAHDSWRTRCASPT